MRRHDYDWGVADVETSLGFREPKIARIVVVVIMLCHHLGRLVVDVDVVIYDVAAFFVVICSAVLVALAHFVV